MTAGTYPIIIEQGATWPDYEEPGEPFFTWLDDLGEPIDLTGWTGEMVFKANYSADPFITLTTENGGLVFGGASGTIDPFLSDEETSALTVLKGIYNLKLFTPSGSAVRLLEGPVTVSREV